MPDIVPIDNTLPPPTTGLVTLPSQVENDLGTQSVTPDPLISASASYAGPTAAGHQRATSMIGAIDQRVAGYEARDAQATNATAEKYRQGVAGEQAAIGGVQAVGDDYVSSLEKIDKERQALYEEAARQEKEASAIAKQSAAEFTSSYQQQLAAVRAMSVNIAGPLAKLSTMETGGLSLAMFAQGFLAAQGININVGAQVDRWVERSIEEQKRKIQQGEAAAQDTLNLWQIAEQNSENEFEARQRYRGFILEGLKSQTDLQASRFNSKLASAQAGVTKAHLETESMLVQDQMTKAHESRVFEQKKWETDTAFRMEQVNLEKRRLAIDEAKARAEADKVKPVKRQIVVDPSDGKAKWIVTEDRINAGEDAKIVAKAQADYESADKVIKEAMAFRSKHPDDQWGHLNMLDRYTEPKRQYEAMVERIAIEMGKASFGLRATDKEAERVKKLIPFEKWYQQGHDDSTWTKFREDVRSNFNSMVNAHADAIPESQQFSPKQNTANPSAKAVYEADVEGKKPVTDFANYEQAKVVGKDSEDVGEHSYGSHMWKKFVTSKEANYPEDDYQAQIDNPNKTSLGKPKEVVSGAGALGNLARPVIGKGDEVDMPGWAVAIDHLANGWAKPKETKDYGDKNTIYFGTEHDTVEEIAAESKKALQTIASGKTADGKEVPKGAKLYAKYLLNLGDKALATELGKNPYETEYKLFEDPKFK